MKKAFILCAAAALFVVGCQQKPKEVAEEPAEQTIRINCLLTVTPENRDAVLALSKELVDSSLTDAGMIDYDIYENATDPSKLLIFETWQDQPSLDVHSASGHFTRIVPQLQEKSEMAIQVLTEAPQEGNAIRLNCQLNVAEENREAALELYKQHAAASLEDEGVVDFDLYLSATNPEKMLFFETWKDQAALDAHAESEHMKQHKEATQGLAESKLESFLLPAE